MFVQKAIQMSIFIFQCMHVCKIKPRFVCSPENVFVRFFLSIQISRYIQIIVSGPVLRSYIVNSEYSQ